MPTRFSAQPMALLAALAAAIGGVTQSVSAALLYDRNAAVAYANANYNKVVTDGYFYTQSYPPTFYGAGTAVPGTTGDDCAHFVSSCIGSPGVAAGGLTIPNRAGTYGEPGAARLDELLVGNSLGGYGTTYQYGTLVSSISQLTPGDVIGYDWDGSGHGSMSGIDHTAIYLGNNQVDCHSVSHKGANWSLGGADDYFFIHITLHDTIKPTAPTNALPAKNSTVSTLTPRLTLSSFADGALGSTQVAAQWELFKDSTLFYDTGPDTTDLLGLTVPVGKLTPGTTYSWQVRYEDNYGDWSTYSTKTTFSTLALPEPSVALLACGAVLVSSRRKRRSS